MLILRRKANQTVVLPGLGVKVTVLKIEGNRVSIGIEAAEDVKILREELIESDQEARELPPSPLP